MTALGTHISVRFMTFSGWRARWRAFGAMGISLRQGVAAPGLCFGKMLGSGAGQGFSIWPDWGTYAWFTVWENPESAEAFWSNDPMFQDLLGYATSVYGWEARPLRGHGTWNGQQPFAFPEAGVRTAGSVAVLTRASIARKQALRFWWNVPRASRGVQDQPGLRYAKGVGEYPLVEQATMSVWNSADELDAFAYRSRQHAPMVQKTRKHQWYSEEMFIRMEVLNVIGELPNFQS
ncbi:MAG: hypothetical protein ACO2YT_04905 [Schleiferiaceae bacterium]|jgi:hypothetical protein|nr:DUF3291 domain-containing protein [Flavobacteriia bacterium]NDA07154.1 DUF3291 domain-containing protein [Flavobacteriia bacterium]NDA27986.1 DUF3291 domain-containing protein [Flavobacteriia bacterium]NDD20059.1 DUF3291 domain-containing protein [Flavobacteriia bacterium]NDD80209.1 DUF3291 domain-containing protein [Flavobacteriia bacterium]